MVVSQYFYPEKFRINDICTDLVRRGYCVTVLTGIPNYPEGKYYQGYGLFKKRSEVRNGIEIIRIPLFPRMKNSIGLVLNYLSFVLSGFFWANFTRKQFDSVFIYEVSPMTQALPGVWYAKRKGIPATIYVMDLWPENIIALTGLKSRPIIKGINHVVDYIYRNCDTIMTSSKSFISNIKARGHSIEKLHFWPQYAEEFYKIVDVPLEHPIRSEIQTELNIVYAGNIGEAQGLEVVIRAAVILKRTVKVYWYLIGNGREKLKLMGLAKELNVDEFVTFIDSKEANQIPYYLALADAALISLKDDIIFNMTIPAKFQSIIACGKPVIACANGETSELVREYNLGYVSEPGNSEKLAENVLKFFTQDHDERSEYGTRAKNIYKRFFDKVILMDKFETFAQNMKSENNHESLFR